MNLGEYYNGVFCNDGVHYIEYYTEEEVPLYNESVEFNEYFDEDDVEAEMTFFFHDCRPYRVQRTYVN